MNERALVILWRDATHESTPHKWNLVADEIGILLKYSVGPHNQEEGEDLELLQNIARQIANNMNRPAKYKLEHWLKKHHKEYIKRRGGYKGHSKK